jgi:hypothetical protein
MSGTMRPDLHWALALFVIASGCGDHAAPAADAGARDAAASRSVASDHDGGASATRHLQLAVSGAQLLVSGPNLGLQLTPADLADDADVVAMHIEFYGVPWDALLNETPPPPEWSARMDELSQYSRSLGRPIFLSISMLNGARERLAATTVVDGSGKLATRDDTSERCYDFGSAQDGLQRKQAYLRYVQDMVARFEPAYVNVAIEVNLFFEKCRVAAPSLIEVSDAAYDTVKALRPGTVVFPSFQIDHLQGYSKDSCPDSAKRDACFDANYAQIARMKRDRFAVSSYPFLNQIGSAADLPADWFSRAARRGDERVVIAETGWLSSALVARADDGSCPRVFSFAEDDSARYLARVLADAVDLDMDLVTWWSDRDLVRSELMTDCPCTFDATWCTVLDVFRGPAQPQTPNAQFLSEVLLKAFGTMGLRRYDGTPRAGHMLLWNAARR